MELRVSIEPAFPPDSNADSAADEADGEGVSIEPAFPPDSNARKLSQQPTSNHVSIEPAFPPDSNHFHISGLILTIEFQSSRRFRQIPTLYL